MGACLHEGLFGQTNVEIRGDWGLHKGIFNSKVYCIEHNVIWFDLFYIFKRITKLLFLGYFPFLDIYQFTVSIFKTSDYQLLPFAQCVTGHLKHPFRCVNQQVQILHLGSKILSRKATCPKCHLLEAQV